MVPLKEYVCDYCGQIISNASEGVLVYKSVREKPSNIKYCSEWQIVHQPGASPAVDLPDGNFCYDEGTNGKGELPLWYLTTDPIDILKRVFETEYGHSAELKDIEYRLTIPFYEEARKYFDKAIRAGLTSKFDLENNPSSALLEVIIERFKP